MSTIIKIEHLHAGYEGKEVLSDINLTVTSDDYLGIIGPNGGGKTTLIRLILGLMKPTSGTIRFFKEEKSKGETCQDKEEKGETRQDKEQKGETNEDKHMKEVKEISMGYLPQYNALDKQFPISVYEVVLSGLSKSKKLFARYTKGQLQRVLLARAIVAKPDVVILDEPNTYIDRRFQKQMYEMLEQINKECAIIIVSHDIAEVLNNVKHIACVNHHLHYHDTADMPREKLEEHFLKV